MSKPEKIEIEYADETLLEDMGLDTLVTQYRLLHTAEKSAEAAAETFKVQKSPIGKEIAGILDAVGVDSVNGLNLNGIVYRTTRVKGDPDAVKLNGEDHHKALRDAMLKIGKLDTKTINKIFAAASIPAPREGHVLVTVQKD